MRTIAERVKGVRKAQHRFARDDKWNPGRNAAAAVAARYFVSCKLIDRRRALL